MHRELNRLHFSGGLGKALLLLSSRMRRRLGEFRPATPGSAAEISISRRHLRRDGWRGVHETLLHEMVHQWQAETGRRLGHGPEFRRRCREIGIDPRATRRLANDLLRRA
jgi:SprT-like family